MNQNNSNPIKWFGKMTRRASSQHSAPQFTFEYHEYPKPIYTEPRHTFSGEFPAVVLDAIEQDDHDDEPQVCFDTLCKAS